MSINNAGVFNILIYWFLEIQRIISNFVVGEGEQHKYQKHARNFSYVGNKNQAVKVFCKNSRVLLYTSKHVPWKPMVCRWFLSCFSYSIPCLMFKSSVLGSKAVHKHHFVEVVVTKQKPRGGNKYWLLKIGLKSSRNQKGSKVWRLPCHLLSLQYMGL